MGTYLLVLFGTGSVAAAVLPGPEGGFWVYIVGVLLGGPLGGLLWRLLSGDRPSDGRTTA